MDRKDFSDLEDQIMSTVKNAFNAIDFANLKRDIGYKAEDTINEFKSKLNELNMKMENNYSSINKKAKNNISTYIDKRPVGTISGIVYMIFGVLGTTFFGFFTLLFIIFMAFFTKMVSDTLVAFVTMVLFLGVSLFLLYRGINLRKRVRRFKKYVRFIDDNCYCLIKDLARFSK